MDVLQIMFAVLGLVAPIITLIVMQSLKSNQSNITNQLKALKEQGTMRGDHLESKIIDVKLYVGEAIEGVKKDFAELKSDVGNRQMIEEGLKQQIITEMHEFSVRLEGLKKDVSIVQSLYDKRIEHEGEVKEAIDELSYEMKQLKKKVRGMENKQKNIDSAIRNNDLYTDEE